MEFLLLPENLAFTVALALMAGIAVLEGTTTLLGAGLSHLLDSVLPDSLSVEADIDLDADLDMDADIDLDIDGGPELDGIGSPGVLSELLGWLCIGKVPLLILLIVFLTGFGLAGLFIQAAVQGTAGGVLPGWIAVFPAGAVAFPMVRVFGGMLGRLLPSIETSAVSSGTFIGRVATITAGEAREDAPAQAKLHDQHGQAHYVMVEPDLPGEVLEAGAEVLLVKQAGARFRGIRNTHAALTDE